jgi:hypothetical protein
MRQRDTFAGWRELISGVVAVGVLLPVGLAVLGLADTRGEFWFVRACFALTALSLIVCYGLWWRGKPRTLHARIAWGTATFATITVGLGFGLPWVNQKQAERAPPEVSLCFVGRAHPVLYVLNLSDKVVQNAKFSPGIFDLDARNPTEPLHTVFRTFDVITPRSASGAYDIFGEINDSPAIKKGDRLVGTVGITCPNCASGRTFAIDIEWQRSGWYSQLTNQTSGNVLEFIDFSNPKRPHLSSAAIATLVSRIPERDRIPIRDLSDFVTANHSIDLLECSEH